MLFFRKPSLIDFHSQFFTFLNVRNILMLTDQEIRALSSGTGLTYLFDLSIIPSDKYEPLFKTLEHFAKKKISVIGFSCDELFKAEQKALGGRTIPLQIINSIAKTKSNYTRNIVELLSFILPRSTRLMEVRLSYLNIRKEHLMRLIAAFGQSTTLEVLYFSKVLIGDALLDLMLEALDPNQIKSITIQYCGITRKSVPKIIQFIQRKDSNLSNNGGLISFNISKTEITVEDQEKINEAIRKASEDNDSLMQNNSNLFTMMKNDGKLIKNQNNNIGVVIKVKNDEDIERIRQSPERKKSDASQKKKDSPHKQEKTVKVAQQQKSKEKDAERRNDEALLNELMKTNQELNNQYNEISQSLNAIQFNNDTYIVGEMAEQFVRFVRELEYKMQVLKERKMEYGWI